MGMLIMGRQRLNIIVPFFRHQDLVLFQKFPGLFFCQDLPKPFFVIRPFREGAQRKQAPVMYESQHISVQVFPCPVDPGQFIETGVEIGNVVAGLCALLTAFNGVPVLFFALYFGYMMFNNVSAYAIPAGVVYSVPNEDLPFISSMRMLMMSVGSTVCIQLFSHLLAVGPAWWVMAISAAVYAAAGVIFKLQYTDALKK